MTRFVVRALLFTAISLSARLASADYICTASFGPGAHSNKGNYGFVNFTTYSGVSCTGTLTGNWSFCSVGAVGAAQCASDTSYWAPDTVTMAAEWSLVREALVAKLPVSVSSTSCSYNPGPPPYAPCATTVTLTSN